MTTRAVRRRPAPRPGGEAGCDSLPPGFLSSRSPTIRGRRSLSARAKPGGRSTLRYMTRDVYRRCPYCREQIEGVFPTGPVPNRYADRDVEKLVSAHLGRHVDELEAELTRPGRR